MLTLSQSTLKVLIQIKSKTQLLHNWVLAQKTGSPAMILTEAAAGPVVARAARAVASHWVTFLILGRALTHPVTVFTIRARWTSLGKRKCKRIN